MKLYHIQTDLDRPFEEGQIIEIGKEENRLRKESYDLCASFPFERGIQEDGKEYIIYQPLINYFDDDKYYSLTEEQLNSFFYNLKKYLNDSTFDRRETILEEVRKEINRNLPTRYKCLWLTEERCIEHWLEKLKHVNGYNLYEVETEYVPFVSKDSLLPNRYASVRTQIEQAKHYWQPTEKDLYKADDLEYLYIGNLKVLKKLK